MAGFEPVEVPDVAPSPAGVQAGARVDLMIENLAYGGSGVARREGFVVLVDRVLPGERIQAEVTQLSRRFARARLLEIVTPSPHRQASPCPHEPLCGGCAYQPIPYPLQLEIKRAQVRELLQRIGKFDDAPVEPVVPSSLPFGYRRRMSYALAEVEGVGGGLHRREDPAAILEVPGCLLPEMRLQRTYESLLPNLRSMKTSQRPRHLELQSGSLSVSPIALFRGERSPSRDLRRLAPRWVEEGILTGVLWQQGSARSRGARGRPRLLAGAGHVEESLADFRVNIPAGSFFQANPPLAARIFQEIGRCCGTGQESILELYAGVGALTLFLAKDGRRVTAVEGNPDSVRAARDNAALNGIPGIEWVLADVREAIDRWGRGGTTFDIVVLDPPRTGLPRQGARRLASIARRKILYLSCDPATLARDLHEVVESGEWKLKEVLPVDFFPHTAGIECLAILEKG